MSPTLASSPLGFEYVFVTPVSVSVTSIVYSTFDSAPGTCEGAPALGLGGEKMSAYLLRGNAQMSSLIIGT